MPAGSTRHIEPLLPAAGATTFNQALTATAVVSTATFQKQVNKSMVATAVSAVATIKKQVNKALTSTAVFSVATMLKQVNKSLISTAVVSTATLVAQKVIVKVLTATAVVTTATMVRSVLKPLAATATGSVASVQKQVNKPLVSTAVVSTATLVARKTIIKVLSATVTATATIVKQVSKILAVPAEAYSSAVLADSPFLYWRLGESAGPTAADTSGNGRTGTYHGSGVAYGAAGAVAGSDTATTFDGAAGEVHSSANIDLSGTTVITVEFWMNVPVFDSSDRLAVELSPNANVSNGVFWFDPNSAGTPGSMQMYMKSLTGVGRQATVAHPSAKAWHHYVAVYDMGASAMKLYVDGVAQSLTIGGGVTSGAFSSSQPLNVASRNAGTNLLLNGSMDEFAIYTSELSQARVTAHYAAHGVVLVPTLTKQVNKLMVATATGSATMRRQVNKILSATVTSTASLVALKVIVKVLSASVSATATMTKQVNKLMTATAVGNIATMSRMALKRLSVSVTSTATMQALKVIVKLMVATPVTVTATMVRQVSKPLTAAVSSVATMQRQVAKRLSASSTATATLTKVRLVVLAATVTATATMRRQVTKTLSVTSSTAASMSKLVSKRLSTSVSAFASLVAAISAPFTDHPTIRTLVAGITGLRRVVGGHGKAPEDLSDPSGAEGPSGQSRSKGGQGRSL